MCSKLLILVALVWFNSASYAACETTVAGEPESEQAPLVLDSVLTPANYERVLSEAVNFLQPSGVLLVRHSNPSQLSRLPSNRIVEFLFANFGNRLEVLPGSKLIGHGTPALNMTLKVSETRAAPTADLYWTGVRMTAPGSEDQYIAHRAKDVETARHLGVGAPEAAHFKEHLASHDQDFIPERFILLNALKISNHLARGRYMDRELDRLYRDLGRWRD